MSDFPKRILHADDDPMIRDIVKRALERYEEIDYAQCEDGKQLLETAIAFKPDLIILDLTMPNMDGTDVMAMISASEDIHAKIVLFTGHKDVKMTPDYEKIGVIGVLHKPISVGVLPERIRYFWVQAQGQEGIPGGGSSGLM